MLRELHSLNNSIGFRVAKDASIQKKRSTITGALAASHRIKSTITTGPKIDVKVAVIAKLVSVANVPENKPVLARPFVVATPVSVRYGFNYFKGVPVVEGRQVAVVPAVPVL